MQSHNRFHSWIGGLNQYGSNDRVSVTKQFFLEDFRKTLEASTTEAIEHTLFFSLRGQFLQHSKFKLSSDEAFKSFPQKTDISLM